MLDDDDDDNVGDPDFSFEVTSQSQELTSQESVPVSGI